MGDLFEDNRRKHEKDKENIFIERLWRSVKYEEVYVNEYDSVKTATERIDTYFDLDNNRRLHEALGYVPPAEIYHNAS